MTETDASLKILGTVYGVSGELQEVERNIGECNPVGTITPSISKKAIFMNLVKTFSFVNSLQVFLGKHC